MTIRNKVKGGFMDFNVKRETWIVYKDPCDKVGELTHAEQRYKTHGEVMRAAEHLIVVHQS